MPMAQLVATLGLSQTVLDTALALLGLLPPRTTTPKVDDDDESNNNALPQGQRLCPDERKKKTT
jgi:hypothetical protein